MRVWLDGVLQDNPPSGAAGGDLSGTYPNPAVANLAITDAKVAAANKDGLVAVPSMRTLGVGAQQAAAGTAPAAAQAAAIAAAAADATTKANAAQAAAIAASIPTALLTTRGQIIRRGAAAAEALAAEGANTFLGGDGTDLVSRTAAQARASFGVFPGTDRLVVTGIPAVDANTVFQLNSDAVHGNTTFTDSSANAAVITRAGVATIHSYRRPILTQSAISSSGAVADYLTAPHIAAYEIPASGAGVGAFTVEAWMRWTGSYGIFTAARIIAAGSVNTQNGAWTFGWSSGGGGTRLNLATRSGGVITDRYSDDLAGRVPAGEIAHVAVVRAAGAAGALTFFLNGEAAGTAIDTDAMDVNALLYVGARDNGGAIEEAFPGYLQSVRFSNVARYTATFQP